MRMHFSLQMLPVFEEFGMKELLPLKLEDPNEGCIRPSEDVYCFLAGDPRVNEQTLLAMTHTLFVRNHNHLAKELAAVNPHWNDETLFQETKHINSAIIQQAGGRWAVLIVACAPLQLPRAAEMVGSAVFLMTTCNPTYSRYLT